MSRIYYFLFLLLIFSNVYSQNFEGRIRYKMSCKSSSPEIPTDLICRNVPDYIDYFIKDGNYKFIGNDSSILNWMLYINSENRTYTKFIYSDTVFWKEPVIDTDSILYVEINKNVLKVLDYECDEIKFFCNNSIHTFYYNTKIAVDKSLFSGHRDGNLYDFFLRSNSLVLKEILESEYSILEYTAIEVQLVKIEKDFFNIPLNIILSKSPD